MTTLDQSLDRLAEKGVISRDFSVEAIGSIKFTRAVVLDQADLASFAK